jgi:hypothetical protein
LHTSTSHRSQPGESTSTRWHPGFTRKLDLEVITGLIGHGLLQESLYDGFVFLPSLTVAHRQFRIPGYTTVTQ